MERKRDLRHFRDLDVYQKAFKAAMHIYKITKSFPAEVLFKELDSEYEGIISMINAMEKNAQKFCF